MPGIKDFIQQNILMPRLKKEGVLVVYDPEERYRDLCLELGDGSVSVIDAGDGSIPGREKALDTFNRIGYQKTDLDGMLVYVPASAPRSEEDKQKDPFSIYTECGQVFPDSEADRFLYICLKAKPDFTTEIRRIFEENPDPSFDVIDAVGSGTNWPTLQALLKVDSANDILFALLAPKAEQQAALKENEAWVSEAKALFKACLGLKLKTRGKTWSSIADELWRFLLFSEFVFDLPEALPESLADVPRAPDAARPLVEDLCERLRNDNRTQADYIDRAESIENELELQSRCRSLKDLGRLDTFPFEERTFFSNAINALIQDEMDTVRAILSKRVHSVWCGKGESQAQWDLLRSALSLYEICDDLERQLPAYTRSFDALIDFYINFQREADRLQREFEQAVSGIFDTHVMDDVIDKVRGKYRCLSAKSHDYFIRQLESNGWPPIGRMAHADIFDQKLAPKLKDAGSRIAFILVDSLRYELGVALEKEISENDPVELQPAFAQLPTTTLVGMASLLPGADKSLYLQKTDSGLLPVLESAALSNVNHRMDVLRSKYGQRFMEQPLKDFVKSRKKPPETVSLIVLRSVEIDSYLETEPDTALRMVQDTLKRIRVAINKLKMLDFQEVIIATDHGFLLNPHTEAGDVCAKPIGDFTVVHNRFVLGSGQADNANFLLPAEQLGIRGDFSQAGGPRGLVPYRAGTIYFHGGASLQECILPVLSIKLKKEAAAPQKPTIKLTYKNNAKRITTRLPVVDVVLEQQQQQLFGSSEDVELLLEAHDKKGNVVGEAKPGGDVNPVTGTVTLKPNERIQVAMKMDLEFEGKFSIKAINPTTMAVYCTIELETDYTV